MKLAVFPRGKMAGRSKGAKGRSYIRTEVKHTKC
jgi:hypothetical protein